MMFGVRGVHAKQCIPHWSGDFIRTGQWPTISTSRRGIGEERAFNIYSERVNALVGCLDAIIF